MKQAPVSGVKGLGRFLKRVINLYFWDKCAWNKANYLISGIELNYTFQETVRLGRD